MIKVAILDDYQNVSQEFVDLKKIEGKYGSGVGTYFRFLRSLLGLNVFISILR